MKLDIGTILRTFIAANGQDEDPTQICNAQLTEDNDDQTIETQKIPGIQYGPTDGKHGFFGMFRAARKIFLSLWDGIAAQTLDQGELLIYSSDASSIVAKIHFKKTGTIQIDTDLDLVANVGGKATVDAATQIDFTAPTINLIGNVNISEILTVEKDAIWNNAVAAISGTNHESFPGNLGFNVGPPLPIAGGGTPAPATPPSTNASGDIIDGGATNLSAHTHTQPNDSGGDTEGPTSGPI
jgi:hypothetical protein